MKYTFEFKLKAVKHYLETGAFIFPPGCDSEKKRKYFRNHVQFWKSKYITMGEDGLKHKENNDVYSPERKLQLIGPILRMEVSLTKQSKILGIQAGTLGSWIKRYKLLGMDGLKCSKRGRPPRNMSEIQKNKKIEEAEGTDCNNGDNTQWLLARISQLEQDNAALKDRNKELEHKDLLSKAEIDYLKKLHALAETKRQSRTSKKRKPSASSAKAEDTKED